MRTAGSKEAFRRVDHGYPLAVARLAREHGTPTFVLNSAIGANPSSRFFYNRVKGELERDLATLGFPSLTFVRPGLIGGRREEARPMEQVASLALGLRSRSCPEACASTQPSGLRTPYWMRPLRHALGCTLWVRPS